MLHAISFLHFRYASLRCRQRSRPPQIIRIEILGHAIAGSVVRMNSGADHRARDG